LLGQANLNEAYTIFCGLAIKMADIEADIFFVFSFVSIEYLLLLINKMWKE